MERTENRQVVVYTWVTTIFVRCKCPTFKVCLEKNVAQGITRFEMIKTITRKATQVGRQAKTSLALGLDLLWTSTGLQ